MQMKITSGNIWGIDVYVVVNGKEHTIMDATWTGAQMPTKVSHGMRYSNYFERNDVDCIYCCSIKVKDFEDINFGTRLINDGDTFYFKINININDSEWTSNEILCNNDTAKTKLLHYAQLDGIDTLLGTNFKYMPTGYDIRLPAEFLPISQKANKEIFQTYKYE